MIEGELGAVSVPSLFRTIADGRRTGLLTVSSLVGGQDAYVYFRDGDLYNARLQPARVQLGARLVSGGLASTEEVDQAIQTQKATKQSASLGDQLVTSGVLRREQLEEIVREQVADTLFTILGWQSGTFSFQPDEETDESIGIEVTVDSLGTEGERRLREWHEISTKVPSLEAIPDFRKDEDPPGEVALTPEEWSVVSHLDGRLSIAQLAQACGFTHLEAGRCIFSLVSSGLFTLYQPEGLERSIEEKEIEAAVQELRDSLQASTTGVGLEEMVLAAGGTSDAVDVESPEEVALPEEPLFEEAPLDEILIADDSEAVVVFEGLVEEPEPEPEEEEPLEVVAAFEPEPEPEPEEEEPLEVVAAFEPEPEPDPIVLEEELVLDDGEKSDDVLEIELIESLNVPAFDVVAPEERPADSESQGPRITLPAFSNNPFSYPEFTEGGRGVVAEELVEEKDSLSSVLSELARPVDGEVEPPSAEGNGEAPEPVAHTLRRESASIQPQFSDPRPVDPLVDTTALIRELASYSSPGDESALEQVDTPPPEEVPPRKAGRFGRKKKR